MGEEHSFVFSEAQFNKLYPFHFLVDQEMKVVACGPSMKKLMQREPPGFFYDLFHIKRPGLPGIGFAQLRNTSQLVILEIKLPSKPLLRGQFEYLENKGLLLFLGSPWFRTMEELTAQQLTLHDFATHDPLIDLLHLIKSKEIVTEETMQLLGKMQLQKNEFSLAAQRLSQLISNLQSGILLEDENRKIVLTNKTFCKMFGINFDPESMIGWDCSNAAEQSKDMFRNPEGFVKNIETLLREKILVQQDKLYLHDGRVFERDYIPMFINDIYRGHLWKYNDITERVLQEDTLKKSEEKYRNIITNINLGLIEVDLDEHILYANQSFVSMSGYEEHELIGKNAMSLFLNDEHWKAHMKNRLDSRKNRVSDVYELPVTTKSGEARWWIISGAPLLNEMGQVIGTIGIHLDITRQKELEHELRIAKNKAENSAQARELFLANMSHEIRTPLSGIYGMMQLLQTTKLDTEQQSYLDAVEKAIENLQNIINDVLDFSKINSGMVYLNEQPFSIRHEIESVCRLASPKAKEKGLYLKMECTSKIAPNYMGDALRLNQVLSNILSNAIKFTELGGVNISCQVLGKDNGKDQVEIAITDTGIGIEAGFLPYIFDKFSQEETGKAKQYGGTGLGMSISKQLVELMHGEITIVSRKSRGTTVRILLPFKETTENLKKPESSHYQGNLNGLKILVAEDNEINATVLRSLLLKEGSRVKLVHNGKELIEEASIDNYDLIITDVQMPVMNGLDAVIWMRKNLSPKLKIIALTAYAFQMEKERCLQAGFDAVLFKPFKRNELLKICLEQMAMKSLLPSAVAEGRIQNQLYDLSELFGMMDHSEEQLHFLLSQFVAETPQKILAIRKALIDRDVAGLRTNIHYLASSIQHLKVSSLYKHLKLIDNPQFITIGLEEIEAANYICTQLEKVIQEIKRNYSC